MYTLVETATMTSPAAAGFGAGATFLGLGKFTSLKINCTIQGATGGTLDVYLQVFDGVDWFDYGHYTQLAAGAAAATWSVSTSREQQQTTIVTVGKNTTPALAANTFLTGEFGDRIRIAFVAGAGTSAGASQSFTLFGTVR